MERDTGNLARMVKPSGGPPHNQHDLYRNQLAAANQPEDLCAMVETRSGWMCRLEYRLPWSCTRTAAWVGKGSARLRSNCSLAASWRG